MNILGIGIDIIEIDRIDKAINKNKRFVEKLFTEKEIEYFKIKDMKPQTIAGNFAAKEAISKAMGTGIREFKFSDMEILRDKNGKPIVKTYNNLAKLSIDYNVLEIKVSISHSKEYAVANAMIIVKE